MLQEAINENQARLDAFVADAAGYEAEIRDALYEFTHFGTAPRLDAFSPLVKAQLARPWLKYSESPTDWAMEELARQVVADSPRMKERGWKVDAGGTRLFATMLRHVVAKTVPTLYLPNQARMNFPVKTDIPAGARTVEHRRIFGHDSGELGIIANKADDILEVTLEAEADTRRMIPLARAVTWGVDELEEAAFGNVALNTELLAEMGRVAETIFEIVAYQGAAVKGVTGLYNDANVALSAVVTGTWATATAAQIYGDCEELIEDVKAANQNVTPNRFGVTANRWRFLNARRVNTDKSVRELLEENYPGLQIFEINRADTYDVAGTGPRLICYYYNPDFLAIAESRRWQLEPPEKRGLSWRVIGRQKLGGAFITVPLTVGYMDGI